MHVLPGDGAGFLLTRDFVAWWGLAIAFRGWTTSTLWGMGFRLSVLDPNQGTKAAIAVGRKRCKPASTPMSVVMLQIWRHVRAVLAALPAQAKRP